VALILILDIYRKLLKLARKIIGPSYRPNTIFGFLYHFLNRCRKFFIWNVSNFLIFSPLLAPKKRLLLVYDTSSQPLSIGDLIIFQAGAMALSAEANLNKVDFIILYDPISPVSSDKTYSDIDAENIFYYLSSVLPISQINPNLGSLMIFDSRQILCKFIVDNFDSYEVWPSSWKFSSKDYLYYDMMDNVLYKHYQNFGKNIQLKSRPFLSSWAFEYFETQISSAIPVTVNLRNNNAYQKHRNANLEAWLSFFKDCQHKYPVKFIVICALNERDARFADLDNVLCTKDYGIGLDQELALIQNSAMHMGVGSGPISMAWFGSNPYLMVNTKYPPGYFKHKDMLVSVDRNISRFCFGTEFQRISSDLETAEFLIEQFAILIAAVDVMNWRSIVKKNLRDKNIFSATWLR
jgi:hypothetical protein